MYERRVVMDDMTCAWAQYGETEIVPGRLAGVTRRLGCSLPDNLNIPAHMSYPAGTPPPATHTLPTW